MPAKQSPINNRPKRMQQKPLKYREDAEKEPLLDDRSKRQDKINQTIKPKTTRKRKKSKPDQSLIQHQKPELGFFSQTSASSFKHTTSSKIKLLAALQINNMDPKDYLVSPWDKPSLVLVKPVSLLQEFSGKGLFAKKDIPKGTILGPYKGEVFSSEDAYEAYLAAHPECNPHYALSNDGMIIDSAKKGNFTRYINFSDSQDNVAFEEKTLKGKKVIAVIAIKEIQANQQLLVNYNTFIEEASKKYFFLNPEDNDHSASDLYQANLNSYHLQSIDQDLPDFGISKGENYFLTGVTINILAQKQLTHLFPQPIDAELSLPCFKADAMNIPLAFNQADSFSPLMLACYLGEVKNCQWLIEKGANIDQQQHQSGNNPLFLALYGYRQATLKAEKQNYLAIIGYLISKQASLFSHDRADRSFLHKAIEILSDEDFKQVLEKIKTHSNQNLTALFFLIDAEELDFFLLCIKLKKFGALKELLFAYPQHLPREEADEAIEYIQEQQAVMQNFVVDYNACEKAILKELISCCPNIDFAHNLLESVNLVEEQARLEFTP